jgi:acetoin:2,6-dichlorophenolindophenol oxidoreductase subunit alpha
VLDTDRQIWMYTQMLRIREFEERVKRTFEDHPGVIRGHTHLADGAEASIVGALATMEPGDQLMTTYRCHGYPIVLGTDTKAMMAEIYGRATGLCKGLGGSMHLVDTEHGFMGATGVVGGNIPMALGSSLAARLGGGDQVAVVFFGDGAVQAGHFNESVNLATLWGLPLIFVCENNGFAEFTPRSAHTNVERVSDVVAPYQLARETVDGNDVLAVRESFGRFLAAARGGSGPFLLECLTHRLRGHYEGDPGQYREAIGKADWQEKDPILRLQRHGASEGWFGEEDAAKIEHESLAEMEEAEEFARKSPFPDERLMSELVYA